MRTYDKVFVWIIFVACIVFFCLDLHQGKSVLLDLFFGVISGLVLWSDYRGHN